MSARPPIGSISALPRVQTATPRRVPAASGSQLGTRRSVIVTIRTTSAMVAAMRSEKAGSIAPVISVVIRRSAADRAGLEVGDVILQVNDQVVETREAMREILADASLDASLRLTIRRGAARLSVVVRPPSSGT